MCTLIVTLHSKSHSMCADVHDHVRPTYIRELSGRVERSVGVPSPSLQLKTNNSVLLPFFYLFIGHLSVIWSCFELEKVFATRC